MANTLTNLIPDLYTALDVVSRELVGMIPGVTRDATADRVAVGQTVRVPIAPASAADDVAPGLYAPDAGNQTFGNANFAITKSRYVPFRWNGEETLQMNNGGAGSLSMQQMQIAQAIRTLTNEIEADLCGLSSTFSRAYSAHATTPVTPFATAGDFSEAASVGKILKDNGAPTAGNRLVINTAAGVNMIGKQSRNDVSGDVSMMRQGVLLDSAGFAISESAQVVSHTKGTGTGYTSHADGFAVGETEITLITGSDTVVAGDVVTFAGDTNKYVVTTGVAEPGVITIAEPGLKVALAASAVDMTIVGSAAQNLAFAPSAIVLAQRMPALPDGGDSADDRMMVTDPRSGLSFELSVYRQYRQVYYELACAWGVKNIKPAHTAILLGQ
jgi:hypothetical protein